MSALGPKNDEVSSLSTKGQISRPVRYKAPLVPQSEPPRDRGIVLVTEPLDIRTVLYESSALIYRPSGQSPMCKYSVCFISPSAYLAFCRP